MQSKASNTLFFLLLVWCPTCFAFPAQTCWKTKGFPCCQQFDCKAKKCASALATGDFFNFRYLVIEIWFLAWGQALVWRPRGRQQPGLIQSSVITPRLLFITLFLILLLAKLIWGWIDKKDSKEKDRSCLHKMVDESVQGSWVDGAKSQKEKEVIVCCCAKRTTPGIPTSSPTVVLTRPDDA